jgi:hypothetical protein
MVKTKKTFDFKIGADPEFILTMQGRKVDAKQTMELMLSKKPGLKYNSSKMGFEVGECGNIGWDGASSTGEVRPNASNNPKEVVNNLATLFTAFTKHIKICDMSTISEFSSVGGHIHLEIPKGEKWSNEKKNTIHRRLASFYLPILIAENKTNLNLRLKQGYGGLKDMRIEERFKYEDGKPGFTFEFRCPSAEWLTTPKVAAATMSYLAVVYHEIINHPKNFAKFSDMIYKSDKQGDALQTLAIMEFDLLTNSLLAKAKKYVRTFERYSDFKEEIEYIFNPKQVIKDKQKADYNIAQGWGLIEKSTMPKKSEVMASKKTIQGIAKKSDFDVLKRVMNIHYNDDTNVALFAENLKDRVAAFNWKLKNNYFIFGMRKGINEIIAKNMKDEYLTGKTLIKTILDKEYMDNLFHKMNQKFCNSNDMTRGTTIDFITGKPKDLRESIIVIGIPYEMRVNENMKPFLNFVWSIEKNEKAMINAKDEALIDDVEKPLEEKGEIYKILTKQTEVPQQVVIDQGSTSLHNHERAVDAMINEVEREEVNN